MKRRVALGAKAFWLRYDGRYRVHANGERKIVSSSAAQDDGRIVRRRKSGDERRREIIPEATRVIAERGFYGASLQEISDGIGITQAGMLRHVKNKNELLLLVLNQFESTNSTTGCLGSLMKKYRQTGEPQFFPLIYRTSVRQALDNPRLTQLYLVLRAEAMDPSHPAHEYFAQRGINSRKDIADTQWNVPQRYRTPKAIVDLYVTMGSALDGLQMRWLGEENFDLEQHWAVCEDFFYPLPEWEGCR